MPADPLRKGGGSSHPGSAIQQNLGAKQRALPDSLIVPFAQMGTVPERTGRRPRDPRTIADDSRCALFRLRQISAGT